jgi:hypothetical protein
MPSSTGDFSPESVLRAAVTELHCDPSDLVISWDELVEPRIHYTVVGKSKQMKFGVWRDRKASEADKNQKIIDLLLSGFFSSGVRCNSWLLEAVAKVCKLDDLTSYLTVVSRECWAKPDVEDRADDRLSELIKGSAKTIARFKSNQSAILTLWLSDPLKALRSIHNDDLDVILAVLLEQCSYDEFELAAVIRIGIGKATIEAVTPEGYIIEADNEVAHEYLVAQYEATLD